MDTLSEDVEEDSKYAFLLGSALRNDDTDQLLTIYDNIIPKDISEDRLNSIKEGARAVFDLEEHEFNQLVLNARTFSLAAGRSSTPYTGTIMSQQQRQDNNGSSSQRKELQNGGLSGLVCGHGGGDVPAGYHRHAYSRDDMLVSGAHTAKASRVTTTKLDLFDDDDEEDANPMTLLGKYKSDTPKSTTLKLGISGDNDSGLPESGKATSGSLKMSSCPTSSLDGEEGDEDGERPGVIDYMPSSRDYLAGNSRHSGSGRSQVRIAHAFNPTYDEEVKLDSSTGGSSSVESPRSETSVTQDEYSLLLGGGDLRLADLEDGRGGAVEMTTMSYEDRPYRASPPLSEHKHLYSNSRSQDRHDSSWWHYAPSGDARLSDNEMDIDGDGEDDEADRALSSAYSTSQSRQQQSHIHRYGATSSTSTTTTSTQYGTGSLSHHKLQVDDPLQLNLHSHQRVMSSSYNMCMDGLPEPHNVLDTAPSKRKNRKTKTRSKDDSDKLDHSPGLDVNGNPQTFDLENYPQMRQPPGAAAVGGKSDPTYGSTGPSSGSSSLTQSSTDPSQQKELDRLKQRKSKRLEKENKDWKTPESFKEYKGNKSVDELVNYINGKEAGSQQLQQQPGQAKKKEKNKRKDQQQLNGRASGPSEGKTRAALPNSGQELKEVNGKSSAPEAMGNTAAKAAATSPEENKETSTEAGAKEEYHDCLNNLPSEQTTQSEGKEQGKTDNHKKSSSDLPNNKLSKEGGKQNSTPDHSNTNKQSSASNNNNKKQSKVKNKKEKPAQVEGENGPLSPAATMVKPTEEVFPESKSSAVVTDTELTVQLNGGHYQDAIDFEQSSDFKEVKKKKKRPAAKEATALTSSSFFTSASSNSPSYYNHRNTGPAYKNSNSRPRAVTPPPMPNRVHQSNRLPVTEGMPQKRDLSPSSFPVLSGHGAQGLSSGARRNSCGDLASESLDSRNESDRESVNSVTAAHGGISYAHMAAAPRRHDNTTSPSSESGVASGCSMNSSVAHTPGSSIDMTSPGQFPDINSSPTVSERKTPVWKGSPTERRHSIGSSPDDKVDSDKTSQRNRQKSGSQELLNRDSALPTGSTEVPAATHTKTSPAAENISSDEPQVLQNSYASLATSGSAPSLTSLVSSGQPGTHQTKEPTKAVVAKDSSDSTTVRALAIKAKPADPSKKTSTSATGSSTNNKSVIFLDKRFGASPPQNLGITFGFDLSPASSAPLSEPASQSTKPPPSPHRNQPVQTESLSFSSPSSLTSSPSATTQGSQPSHIPSTRGQSSETSNNKVPKVATIAPYRPGLPNGLVFPSSPATAPASELRQSVAANSSIKNTSVSSVARTSDGSSPKQDTAIVPGKTALPHVEGMKDRIQFSPHHPPPPLPAGSLKSTSMQPSTPKAPSAQADKLPSDLSRGRRVVYGLKVKPDQGCGSLIFLPPPTPQRNEAQLKEMSKFLIDKWCYAKSSPHDKGSGAFTTVTMD